jgi:hypothetical protein
MASVSGEVVAFATILLIYLLAVSILVSGIMSLAGGFGSTGEAVTQSGMDGFYKLGYSHANGSTIQDLRYDGFPLDLGIVDYSGDALGGRSWNISTARGLYPSNVGSKNSIIQKAGGVVGEYGARAQLGRITYHSGVSPYISQTITLENLELNETDILIGKSKSLFINTHYYYLAAYNGEFYLLDVVQTPITSYVETEYHISGYSIPSNCTVSVAYFINEKWLEIFSGPDLSNQQKLFSGSYNMNDYNIVYNGGFNVTDRTTYSFMEAGTYQPIDITTNNWQLGVISIYQSFVVVQTDPFSSGDWAGMAKVFAMILLWNVSGIPWEVNILFIKIPLIAFAVCCIVIAQGFIP